MELKRASLIIGTPPATPRNSLLLTSNSGQMFDLQEFLSKNDSSISSHSQRDTIHEVEETESCDHLDKLPSASKETNLKTSQHSMSQVSKSSVSLHSSHSVASVLRSNDDEQSATNPEVLASNLNNNSSNTNNFHNSMLLEVTGSDACRQSICSSQSDHVEPLTVSSCGNSYSYTSLQIFENTNPSDRLGQLSANGSDGASIMPGTYSRSHVASNRENSEKYISRKTFHMSSNDMLTKIMADNPPLIKTKVHRSATELVKGKKWRTMKLEQQQKDASKSVKLSLLDPSQLSKVDSGATERASGAMTLPRLSRENLRQVQPLDAVVKLGPERVTQVPAGATSSSWSHCYGVDELLTWEDFLASSTISDNSLHGGTTPPPVPPRPSEADYMSVDNSRL